VSREEVIERETSEGRIRSNGAMDLRILAFQEMFFVLQARDVCVEASCVYAHYIWRELMMCFGTGQAFEIMIVNFKI
jgi:hypothetical protein